MTEPAKILDKTRELVIETFEKSDHEVKDGMDISFSSLNTHTNELQWAGANNPLYHIKKIDDQITEKSVSDSTHYVGEIKADKQPIGKYFGETPYTNHSYQLKSGEMIFMTSDGYPDQFGGPEGKKMKSKAFKKLLLKNFSKPAEEQKIILKNNFEQWKGAHDQVDDVCVIGIRV